MMVLIIPLIFFVYAAGYVGGMLSGFAAIFYALIFFSEPGNWFYYSDENVYKLVTIVLTVFTIVVLVGRLKERDDENHRAMERAEEQDEAKSVFLATMSHEIRTPMNVIIGMTDLAKKSDDPERISYCLEKVNIAAEHLLGVINDILDISKINAGKLELSNTDFSLEQLMQRVTTVTSFRAEQKKQKVIVKIDDDVPKAIVADRQRLTQVLTNLLTNAVKFTPEEGTITLRVQRVKCKSGYCHLRFEVQDTGIGISQEGQEQLFHSFSQADDSISRRFGGTGLGLSISKQIVEMMNGTITVESEENEGSLFYFTIYVPVGKLVPEKKETAAVDPNGYTAPADLAGIFNGIRILLAEDVEINQEIMKAMLVDTGIQIDCAADGREAVEHFRQAPRDYDAILMDIHMPQLDGYEATREIRRIQTETDTVIPIIAMTANVFKEDIERCKEAGMDDHIGKPVDLDDLIQKLYMYIYT